MSRSIHPDYEALRARQARAQESIVTALDEWGNYINHELAAEVKLEIAAISAALRGKQ